MVQRNFLICWIFQIDYQISKLRLLGFYWKIIKHIKYLIWLNLILHKLFGLIGINQTNSIICWLQWSTQVTKLKKKNAHFFLLSSKLHEDWKTKKNTNLQIIGYPSFPNTSSHLFPRSHGCIMLYHRVSDHQRHFLSHNRSNLVKNVANLPPPVLDHPSPRKTINKRKPNWKQSQI